MISDPRLDRLAEGLAAFSTELKKGERVLIDAFDVPDTIVVALIQAARRRGAKPYVQINRARVSRELMREADDEQVGPLAEVELARMRKMDAYIALRGSDNIFENSDVPADKVQLVSRLMKPVLDHRVGKTKWVVLRWPTPAMAQQAAMSTEAFEDFYFRVCTLDYRRMEPGMKALAGLMRRTDRVRITGPGTDLSFSIKAIGARECGGKRNIPDGEVFSCPVKESVEGVLQYNAPTVYLGTSFDQVRLGFKKGKIVDATANNTKRLNEILDSDPGARYIGEFAIGFNPHILEPMRDILFDEKIAGSFHFTPGQAYADCGNGNRSQVHWDLVCIQRPEYGGGEIWFDGKLIRKNGRFVPPSLHKLNPEHLLWPNEMNAQPGLAAFVQALPKTETHLHIEGALPYDMLTAWRPESYPPDPPFRRADFRYPTFPYFEEVLLDLAVPWYTSPERYHETAKAIFAKHVAQNVKYVETSFHLPATQILNVPGPVIVDAILSAAPDGLEVRVFTGMKRSDYGGPLREAIDSVTQWEGLAGIDLHGFEQVPTEPWTAHVWSRARAAGLVTKCHAGEFGGPSRVKEAIEELGVKRVQHGVRSVEDPAVMALAAERGVTFDVCPISNVRLKVASSIAEHPLRKLRAAGIRCTISTDDPLCFGNTLNGEYIALGAEGGFSRQELGELAKAGWEVADVPAEDRRRYLAEIDRLVGNAA